MARGMIWRIPVHPHGCGEREPNHQATAAIPGSSPRLWGTLHSLNTEQWKNRFIPTAVGNACNNANMSRPTTVHPHGCGERVRKLALDIRQTGSSPRLWGTRKNADFLTLIGRFIPTAVGNASTSTAPDSVQSVHPHGCGERYMRWALASGRIGSSPRLWGTLHRVDEMLGIQRFIPTAVGNASV